MGNIFLGLSLWSALATPLFATEKPRLEVVTPLTCCDVHEGLVFHAGHLWIGRNRHETVHPFYQLEVYAPGANTPLATARLPHTLSYVYPYGPDRVLITGKSIALEGTWTYYTVGRMQNGRLTVQTTRLPDEFQISEFAGNPTEMYFTEVGMGRILAPEASNQLQVVSPFISRPGKMLLTPQWLFVLEKRGSHAENNLLRLNLRERRRGQTFPVHRDKLSDLIDIDADRLAVSETNADQVLLVNKTTNRLVETLSVRGEPSPMARWGKCLVVGSLEGPELSFFDTSQSPTRRVSHWDLRTVGGQYKNLKTLSVDATAGAIYGRSVFTSAVAGNTEAVVRITSNGETAGLCQAP